MTHGKQCQKVGRTWSCDPYCAHRRDDEADRLGKIEKAAQALVSAMKCRRCAEVAIVIHPVAGALCLAHVGPARTLPAILAEGALLVLHSTQARALAAALKAT